MIEVKKTENETSASLIRRFTKKIQQSSLLKKAREQQFKKRPESNLVKKKKAIKNARSRNKWEYLKKLGKVEEKK
jgi:ribosomal protein S21